jgi:general secretion pathway protein J
MKQNGFTLMELLIALAVFALLSVMAYGGLRSVLTAKAETERQATRLKEVEMAMLFLSRDLEQAVARPVRNEYGDPQPALRLDVTGKHAILELTRAGWANPAFETRSTLQRIAYAVNDDGELTRAYWHVLDRPQPQDSVPAVAPLLKKVSRFRVRWLDASRKWGAEHEGWPPEGAALEQLPLAMEVVVELEDLGEIVRLFRLPGA